MAEIPNANDGLKTPKTSADLQGTERAQCPSCKEVFSTTSNFDKHRKGKHGVDRHCVDPEMVGLVIVNTKTGSVWKGKPPENSIYKN